MRRALTAVVVALAVAAPAAPAVASHKAACAPQPISAQSLHKAAKHAKKAKKDKARFSLGGTLESVSGQVLTLKVHGGKDKCLRNISLAVTVADTAKVKRDGSITSLGLLLAGDHVHVKGTRSTLDPTATAYTATKVSAESPGLND